MWHAYYVHGAWPMLVLGVLFWGSVIALVVWGVRRLSTRGTADTPGATPRTPMDHLKERYAKGEISKDEFDRIRRDLLG